MQHIPRSELLRAVRERLEEVPVVGLPGPRQVGKTTLARQVAASWPGRVTVYDLEATAGKAALSRTPERLLRGAEGLVVLDEVQRMPQLFEMLRPVCDAPDRKAVFLLLGSVSWDLVKGVSESLAGRILFVDVGGLSLAEAGTDAGTQDRLWMRGGFPRAFLARSNDAWARWMEAFTRTFLERDVPVLGPGVAPAAVGRFWRMLAHFHGQTWNAAALARSMDVRPKAVNHYRDLLEGTFMVRVLRPWFQNLGKRLVKSPRVYLRDSGVLHYLLGIGSRRALHAHPHYGASWEGFALEQTLLAHGERDAWWYRTQRGAELDLLLVRAGKRWGFEFQCSDAPRTTKSMRVVMDDLDLEHLWVVYPGEQEYPLDDHLTALPLARVGELTLRPAEGWSPRPGTSVRSAERTQPGRHRSDS